MKHSTTPLARVIFGSIAASLLFLGGCAAVVNDADDMGAVEEKVSSDSTIIKPTTDFNKAEAYEALPAGAATYRKDINQNAFSHASANMSFERELDFKIGNAFFRKIWVSSPSSTKSSDGLGPLFNARSCQRCHIKDGRGHAPENDADNAVSMLMRLSIPAQNKADKRLLASGHAGTINEPIYGGQLQDFSVADVLSEGKISITYAELSITLNGDEKASLRKPNYQVKSLNYGALHKEAMLSARVAPQMIGLGLLEAISEQDILAHEDIEDADKDGISGKANWVWSKELNQLTLGRFGYKSGQPTLNQQNQAAFNGDIGLSTPLFLPEPSFAHSGDCTTAQKKCQSMPDGSDMDEASNLNVEVSQMMTDKVLHYSRNLAVPERRNVSDFEVLAGKKLFYQSGCISCHTPKFITPRETAQPEQARQLIWPYTDMLLHDMGEGLADNRPEGLADGQEWRTAPLWGIGLTPVVNGHSYYLHDGRARNLLEAVLWHGGEAQTAQSKVLQMTQQEREQLIKFIESL